MKKKKKIVKALLVLLMAIGIFTGISSNVTKEIKAATDPSAAPGDWAFTEDSISLHDAILDAYPAIDQAPNGNADGYISKVEAASWTGTEISLSGKGITGTLDGLEYFTNSSLVNLNLHNNSLTGKIPEQIFYLTSLKNIILSKNQLSGSIDTYNLSGLGELKVLNLSHNNLSGEWPVFTGLGKLEQLHLAANSFTVSINKVDFSPLVNLQILSVYKSSLYGEMPDSIYELPLKSFDVANNPGLTGNPASGFNDSSNNSLTYVSIQGTGMVQAKPDASTLLDSGFIYDNLSETLLNTDKTGPADGLTQEDIDRAQESADNWSEPTKSQWQENIDKAQDMLDAQNSVLDLLNDTKTDVQETTTQTSIDDAQVLVTALPDGQYKTDLQAEIDLAQEYLNNRLAAQAKVEELFTDSNHVIIKDTTNQNAIDDAQALVTALPDSVFKDALQVEIDKAQAMLDAKGVVEDLFTDSKHIDINDITNQAAIDNARNVVSQLSDGELKTELNKEIDKAQDMLNAKDKVDNLFTDGTHTDIIDGLIQGNIDDAQKAVDKLPNGNLKDDLQKEIDKAQNMLDAKNKVDNLFTDDTHTNIPDNLTQKDIDKAQDAVDKLPNGDLKDALQKEIDKAQDMLNARDAANDLLDKDGNLNSGVTQKEIDKAQDLVNKLPDGELKTELQAIIDEAQKQLDAQNKKNPSTAPTVDASSSVGGKSVNTSDTTNLSLYGGLLMLSLGGIAVFMKRKETE